MIRGFEYNPVLVKEIRQAQRGKIFPIALVATISVAMLSCLMFALDNNDASMHRSLGPGMFQGVYWMLAAALFVLVPFQAFMSMGAEWDDNTFEMLVLSNLKPGQIIGGKIFAAMTQSLLLFATFLPFVAVAFLMRGVGMASLALILSLTLITSLILITMAVMLSTLTRKRFLRVLLMVLLAMGLGLVVTGGVTFTEELIRRPDIIGETDFWQVVGNMLIFFSLLAVLSFLGGCNMLAHEEENRSTNVRVLLSVAVVTYLIIMAVNTHWPGMGLRRDAIFGMTTALMFPVGVLSVMFCCEPERLGRRVLDSVPKNPWLAMLTMPWFPGGGRGVVLLLIHLSLMVVGILVIANWPGSSVPVMRYSGMHASGYSGGVLAGGGYSMLGGLLYVLLYSLVTMGFLHRWAKTPRRRMSLRAITLASPLFYLFVPAAFGLLIGDRGLQNMRHIGNPLMMISSSSGDRFSEPGYAVFLFFVVVLGFLLNGGRIVDALNATEAASRARVAKDLAKAEATGELATEAAGEVTDA